MSKKVVTGVYRGDIWMCNIPKSENLKDNEQAFFGLHPCVISSNWKNNIKSNLIQISPITSNTNKSKLPTHVELNFEEEGLLKDSVVLGEIIHTVNKCTLVRKIGSLSSAKLLQLQEALKIQLELNGRYNQIEADELEDLFTKQVDNMNVEGELNLLKQDAFNLYVDKKYEQSIEKYKEVIEATNKSNIQDRNKYFWNSYYAISLCYIKLRKYSDSLEFAKGSLKYLDNANLLSNDNYILSMWLLAENYSNLNNKEKAIEIYKSMAIYYNKINDYKQKMCMCFNIFKLQKNINGMTNTINIVKRYENIEDNEQYINNTYKEIIQAMYNELEIIKQVI